MDVFPVRFRLFANTLAIATTLCLVVAAPSKADEANTSDASSADSSKKHSKAHSEREKLKKEKHEDEGYYGSINTGLKGTVTEQRGGEGYYATIPSVKDKPADSAPSQAPAAMPTSSATETTIPAMPNAPQNASALGSSSSAPWPPTAVQNSTTSAQPNAPVLVAKPTMATATKAFNGRQFGEALREFQILDQTGFCSDNVHYYIARCYQQLSQVAPALDHYGWVISYSKSPNLKYYAEVASAQLSKYQSHRTHAGSGNNFQRASFG
jgi:hypothetical protein